MSRKPTWGTGNPKFPTETARRFHSWYYRNAERTWKATTWRGVPVQKNPFDLWTYAEIIQRVRPGLIIECGTLYGGSALYLADLCEIERQGFVLSIDIAPQPDLPQHGRLSYYVGDTLAPETLRLVHEQVQVWRNHGPVMVILDDDHHAEHVLAELRAYSGFVTPGSYLVVEDGNLGREAWRTFGPGPTEAIEEWYLYDSPPFEVDQSCERHGFSFNPSGWLRRCDGGA